MSNYISFLNSLLLAGATALSSGQGANFNNARFNYSNEARQEEPRQESVGRSAYARQVDAWFSELERTHGSYLPKGMRDLRTLNVSDDALEILAHTVYNNVKATQEAKKHNNEGEDRHYRLEQHRLPDGSYLWIDLNSGDQLRATKVGHHYNISGSQRMILKVGGRGEAGTIMKMLEDDDPNHDYPMKKAA